MKVHLDPATKRVLLAILASPKTPREVSQIHGIPVIVVWQKIRRLEELGIAREVLSFLSASGEFRRYFEAELPIDTAEDELTIEA